MEKRFAVFNRYSDNSLASKNTRIDNLCENLDLKQTRAGADTDLSTVLLSDINYVLVKQKLQKYIDGTKEYLRKAFEGIN